MPPRKTSPEEAEQIRAAITTTRERRGLTIAQIDRLIASGQGRSDSGSVRQISNGGSSPSVALLFDLARALDCNWTDLLGPPPGGGEDDAEWQAGYRAGVGDALGAVRHLVDG